MGLALVVPVVRPGVLIPAMRLTIQGLGKPCGQVMVIDLFALGGKFEF